MKKHAIVLKVDLTEDLPPVLVDRVQLQQVALNILVNAIDAMSQVTDRQRTLTVRTAPIRFRLRVC